MINLAVINLKEFVRLILKIFLSIAFIILVFNFIKTKTYTNSNMIYNGIKNIENNLVILKYHEIEYAKKESGIKRLLKSEIAILGIEEELMEKENQEELIEFDDEELNLKKLEEIKEETINKENNAETKIYTEIIKQNNKEDKYTDVYNTVHIKNESKYTLTAEMIEPDVNFNNKNIIIYHTHTCESYTPTELNNYEPSGNYRTTDYNYNVARVGNELSNNLIELGYKVQHDKTFHDYPAYTGSYTRSLTTIKRIISNNNSDLIIDLHRDALGSNSNYGPCVRIGDEIVAQLMFVIGTNGGGLEHTNWNNNLKLAIKIQEKANELYPRPF